MKTLRQLKARALARTRRRLSGFTNNATVRESAEVVGPREPQSIVAALAGVRPPREAVFVAAPPGVSELGLGVPLALTANFSLPEPEVFRRVEQASKRLGAQAVSG